MRIFIVPSLDCSAECWVQQQLHIYTRLWLLLRVGHTKISALCFAPQNRLWEQLCCERSSIDMALRLLSETLHRQSLSGQWPSTYSLTYWFVTLAGRGCLIHQDNTQSSEAQLKKTTFFNWGLCTWMMLLLESLHRLVWLEKCSIEANWKKERPSLIHSSDQTKSSHNRTVDVTRWGNEAAVAASLLRFQSWGSCSYVGWVIHTATSRLMLVECWPLTLATRRIWVGSD